MPPNKQAAEIRLFPVTSSNIHSIGFDPDHGHLHIQFHSGHSGYYNNVSVQSYSLMMASPSKGKFLNGLIKNNPGKHQWTSLRKPEPRKPETKAGPQTD